MNEKRFTFDYEVEFEIFDRVTKKHYDGTVGCQEKICDLLNEQQATINELKEAIDYLKTVIRYTIPNEMVADVFKQIGEEYE